MVTGYWSASGKPVVRLVVGWTGNEQEVDAEIDIGYTGVLTLPPARVAALKLPQVAAGTLRLAGGQHLDAFVHWANLTWDGVVHAMEFVHQVDDVPSVGLAFLRGYELILKVVPGGSVILDRLPQI